MTDDPFLRDVLASLVHRKRLLETAIAAVTELGSEAVLPPQENGRQATRTARSRKRAPAKKPAPANRTSWVPEVQAVLKAVGKPLGLEDLYSRCRKISGLPQSFGIGMADQTTRGHFVRVSPGVYGVKEL